MIGGQPKRIYEIGSGKAELVSYLAELGHTCKATEITHERGQKHGRDLPTLTWGVSDGVHLDRFEDRGSYDLVISNQVVEHLHPDDLIQHFKAVHSIFAEGGRYILSTPHAWYGPWDISKVFKCRRATGMHLKEYTYRELRAGLQAAGFARILAIWKRGNGSNASHRRPATASPLYLSYRCLIERVLAPFLAGPLGSRCAKWCEAIGFSEDIFLIADKGAK